MKVIINDFIIFMKIMNNLHFIWKRTEPSKKCLKKKKLKQLFKRRGQQKFHFHVYGFADIIYVKYTTTF